ncbi:hypothetical protein [Haliscomenobacter sp.]|uniref:hypothetical protein n=1 Tax=Haliscomenobacter sp. TaxID=2717303 RepID=UPI003BAA07EE
MPQKSYLIILCFCSILACSNQPGSKPPPKEYFSEVEEELDEQPEEPLKPGIKVQFEFYQFDTTFYASNPYEDKSKRVRRWSEVDEFFPVFRFSKEHLGIAIEIEDGGHYPFIDSIFWKFIKAEQSEVDNDPFTFKKSKSLEAALLKTDTTTSFYVYCSKGVTRSSITEVLYSYDDCYVLLSVGLTPIDTAQFGQPLIASKQLLELKYATVPAFQKDLLIDDAYWVSRSDYQDETLPRQFAYNEDYFLVYDDDFRWYYDKNSTCLFPTRRIFKLEEGNKVKMRWASGIDLFGIACD